MLNKCCFDYKAKEFPLDITEYFKIIENYVCPICNNSPNV